jgi:L-lactate dehydrogenase
MTAGAKQAPGETRLQLLRKNASIIESVASDIANTGSKAVLLMVSNPVDVLTYVAARTIGWERGRVIGSGTVLDSARFRSLLSQHCNVDVHNVHGYMLGEHGDSEFAAWSMTNVAGMQIDRYCSVCGKCGDYLEERRKVEQSVRDSAYHIIGYKGTTCFAVGLALVHIVAAILRGQRSVLTVSTLLEGEYGLEDVCLSVPCVVSECGVAQIPEAVLSPQEIEALAASAAVLKDAIASLGSLKTG